MSPGATGSDAGAERSARLRHLLGLLAERGRISVNDAARELGVSLSTVRRDFDALAEQQLAERTHGGLVPTNMSYDLPVRYRVAPNGPKERIARAVMATIEPGQCVGLNGGTTTTAVARQLGVASDSFEVPVTVVTNALNIAAELVVRRQVVTMTTGGVARPNTYELIGPLARRSLDQMWLDVMVLGVGAISVEQGAGCLDHDEAEVNAEMVARAARIVVAADASKLGRHAFARICSLDAIDELVTDEEASADVVEGIRSSGVTVTVV